MRVRLPPDAVALLRLPPRARAAVAREAELELGPAVLEIGGRLVPAERGAVRWALGAVPASARGRLAALAPGWALALAAPAAIARPPGSRPLAAWLRAHGSGTSVVAAPGTAFLLDGERPRLAAKVGAGPPARRELTGSSSELQFVPYDQVYGQGIEDMLNRKPSIEKVRQAIGWRPALDLDRILADVVDWARTAPTPVELADA